MKSEKFYPHHSLTFLTALAAISLTLCAPSQAKEKQKGNQQTKHEDHKAGHGAHVHGNAKLTIALDTASKGTLLLESPGDGIMGFEHAATSDADKKTQAAALDTLSTKSAILFGFDPAAGCSLTKNRVEILKEDHDDGDEDHHGKEEGEHNEVEAEYALNCAGSVTGTELTVSLGKTFPRIKMLDVQILKDKGQNSTKLKNGTGNVKL